MSAPLSLIRCVTIRPIRATSAASLSTGRLHDGIGLARRAGAVGGAGAKPQAMSRRIYFDGLNLSLELGTGIATYTRMLARVMRELGNEIGVVYSSPHEPAKDPLLREITFFDPNNAARISRRRGNYNWLVDQFRYLRGVRPAPLALSGSVLTEQFGNRIPQHDRLFLARNLFNNARGLFRMERAVCRADV